MAALFFCGGPLAMPTKRSSDRVQVANRVTSNSMRIAITGGIADGKSTVCGMLAEMGYPVASADEIVRELHEDPEILERIRREVGTEFVNESGLDKPALRAAIGRDGSLRQKLNGIFHVPTMRKLVERTETDGIAFAEVPLLIETATQGWFDEVWVVEAGRDEQLRRLAERLGDEAAAVSMLATQLPTGAKIPFADRIVRTNEALDAVRLTIARHVRDLVEG